MTRTCTYCSGPIIFATEQLTVVPAGAYMHTDWQDCQRFLRFDTTSPLTGTQQHAVGRSVAHTAGALEPGDDYGHQVFETALLADDYTLLSKR